MRKINPNDIWSDFETRLDEQEQFWIETWDALPTAAQRTIAAGNYALTLGVMFEGYVNDLIFAYANADCTKVMDHLHNSVVGCLKTTEKAARAFEKFGEFRKRTHLSVAELREILDPKGRNTSFPDHSAIGDRARQWLITAHASRFINLTAQDKAVIDSMIAIRNNLAHRSKNSLDRLNDTLEVGALHGTGLQRNVNRVRQTGHYLKAISVPDEARVDTLARLLTCIAQKLVL